MLSRKHDLPVPLDTAADGLPAALRGLKFHQDVPPRWGKDQREGGAGHASLERLTGQDE